MARTSPGEFRRFVALLPDELDLWFIPVRPNKSPDVPSGESSKDKKYRLTIREAEERIEGGGNVGLYLRGALAVMDVDDPERAREILGEGLFSDTLTVESRSGKPHLYFLRGEDIVGRDIPSVVELRTGWRYVLVPGSCAYDRKEYEETGRKSWGSYSVENAMEPRKLTVEDLPEELYPLRGEADEPGSPVITAPGEHVENRYGWELEKIREEDEKLDALLSEINPDPSNYPSPSEADFAACVKLLYWEFEPRQVKDILREHRARPKILGRPDYVDKTVEAACASGRNRISDVVDVDTYRPGNIFDEIEIGGSS